MQQQGPAAHRRRTNPRPGWQILQRLKRPDQRIPSVIAWQDSGKTGAIGKRCFHILHRMHSRIGITAQQPAFQLFDEQALAAGIGQRAVQNLVTFGGQTQHLDRQWCQPVSDDSGLSGGKRGCAAGEYQRLLIKERGISGHWRLF